MPKFVIERAIPGLGALKPAELQSISQKSCGVLQELGPDVPPAANTWPPLLFEDADHA